jgi:hypothetical protein
MNLSHEGIGQWATTFACSNVKEGDVVTILEDGTVGVAVDGHIFCGQVLACDKDGKCCSVVMRGMVTVSCQGEVALGNSIIVSDGNGGVREGEEGHYYWVVNSDPVAKTVTFLM